MCCWAAVGISKKAVRPKRQQSFRNALKHMVDFFYPRNLVILAHSIPRAPLGEYSHHLVLGLQPL